MLKEIAQDIDRIIEPTEDPHGIFVQLCAYVYQIPLWRLGAFYLYTFTFLRNWETGRTYRRSLKYGLFTYHLRYALFKRRVRCRIAMMTHWFMNP